MKLRRGVEEEGEAGRPRGDKDKGRGEACEACAAALFFQSLNTLVPVTNRD